MSLIEEHLYGAAVLTLAGNEPTADDVQDDTLVRAWIFFQLIESASTVQAVVEGDQS